MSLIKILLPIPIYAQKAICKTYYKLPYMPFYFPQLPLCGLCPPDGLSHTGLSLSTPVSPDETTLGLVVGFTAGVHVSEP